MTHLKRIAAPKTWPIKRKQNVWITKQNPGPHTSKTSISLNTVFKDLLKYTKTTRETKRILNDGKILVNQKPRKGIRFPLGVFDVLSLPTGENFRLLYDRIGKFVLKPVKKEEAEILLYKIKDKTILKNKKIQLNFNDGTNLLVPKDEYSVGDTIVMEKGKIKFHFNFDDSSIVYVIGGKHIGTSGELKKSENKYLVKTKKDSFLVLKEHIFVIGKDKPLITISEK